MSEHKSYLVRSDYTLYEKYDDWKEDYTEFLELFSDGNKTYTLNHEGWVVEKRNKRNVVTGPYRDPDGNCFEFYKDLATFLNEREVEHIKQEQYHYEAWGKPFGIKVINNKGELQFYLKSDQFGFSRPSTEHKHPYDVYLYLNDEDSLKKDKVEQVCEWIYYSRTIGGSFLWPTNMMKGSYYANYNTARGGSNPFEDGKYKGGKYKNYPIEDRVDLTLLDIFLYYNNKDYSDKWNKTILYKWFENEKNEGANKKIANQWLGHFGSFEKYVDFFCFNDFVHEIKNKYKPIDIVESKLNKEGELKGKEIIKEKEYFSKNREEFSIYDKDKKTMEKMFNNVNILITRRTETMEKIINEYRRSQHKKN